MPIKPSFKLKTYYPVCTRHLYSSTHPDMVSDPETTIKYETFKLKVLHFYTSLFHQLIDWHVQKKIH